MTFLQTQTALLNRGKERIKEFCKVNNISLPKVIVQSRDSWSFSACAYYRPEVITICLEDCGRPASEAMSRNWSWPGSTVDRTPYGVLAHELGHHVDYLTSDKKFTYSGDYSIKLRKQSGEPPITTYCPNDGEWFAEVFRLFVTNPDLLRRIRPKTYKLLIYSLLPCSELSWKEALGKNCPERVLRSQIRKMVVKV